MKNILLVEDDLAFVQLIENFLRKNGYKVITKMRLKDAAEEFREGQFDLILLDYHLPDGTALEFLEKLKLRNIKFSVIIMTSFNDVRTAVRAMQSGVLNYITKPVNPEELLLLVDQAVNSKIQKGLNRDKEKEFVKGDSPFSKELNRYVDLVSPTNMTTMIFGESGTGKENIARAIHQKSQRADGPFIALDCGALSDDLALSELFGHVKGAFTGAVKDKKGDFELADGGTLFLDEVGNLSYSTQVKLLRVLQEQEVQPLGSDVKVKIDVRIITATNADLKKAVKNGCFREDLFHRLNEFAISVPTLQQRIEDLDLFCDHFINTSNRELNRSIKGISTDVMQVFKLYDWPGNLRELKNIIKRAVLLSTREYISLDDIPHEMKNFQRQTSEHIHSDLKLMNEINEKELILKTLSKVKFNKSKAASLLNIDRKTLYIKLAKYSIEV